jgi:hypothetical protein
MELDFTKINGFWQYLAEHIHKLDMDDLRKDLVIISSAGDAPVEKYAAKLTTSGLLYIWISTYFKQLTDKVTFMISSDLIRITDPKILAQHFTHPVPHKVYLNRYCFILTTVGKKHRQLVEQIYAASFWNLLPNSWIVIKYIPAENRCDHTKPQFILPIADTILRSVDMGFNYIRDDNGLQILLAVASGTPGKLVEQAFWHYCCNLFGEIITDQITIKAINKDTYPGSLYCVDTFYEVITTQLKKERVCTICYLGVSNVELNQQQLCFTCDLLTKKDGPINNI